jgi:glutamate/tyrosine decarboxylase-like PLP-dependent enzyme
MQDEILEDMRMARAGDIPWQQGKAFSLVFQSNQEVKEVAQKAYLMYFSENGLNPAAFPSLRKFETEVVSMSAHLLGGDKHIAGNMTTGGTESVLMAVKTARNWARATRPEIQRPEIILPISAHPAFDKAAEYFNVHLVKTDLDASFQADPHAIQACITPNTIMLVGSAPSYPQGIVDPIAEIAQIAQAHGVLMHVDACVGGFILPFVRRLGYPVPEFDFTIPGVTSISADLHKYAYSAKGASVILYRSRNLRRKQFFAATDWPGGIYASPTMAGTRPGGAIASAWAVMNFLGEQGYLELTRQIMDTRDRILSGIHSIPGLYVLGNPHMSVLAIASSRGDIYTIGDEMSKRGWHLDRQQLPPSLHLTIHAGHANVVDQLLEDLRQSTEVEARPSLSKFRAQLGLRLAQFALDRLPPNLLSRLMKRASHLLTKSGTGLPKRSAAMYGLMGSLPNRGDLRELVLDLLDQMTSLEEENA